MVEDENGQIVRETMKDTDVLARYKTMHEILVYLSHLDHDDTENQMLEKLRLQVLLSPFQTIRSLPQTESQCVLTCANACSAAFCLDSNSAAVASLHPA